MNDIQKYFESGNFEKVRKICKGQNTADAYRIIGKTYLQEKNPPMAVKFLNKALALNENHIDALTDMAIAYDMGEEFEKAEKYFRKVLELANTLDARFNLAINLGRQKKYKEAEEHFHHVYNVNKVFNPQKNHINVYERMIYMYINGKDIELLKDCTIRVYDITKDYTIFHSAANYYYTNNDAKTAIMFYKMANEVKENDFHANNNLGLLYMNQMEFDVARDYFLIANKIKPNTLQVLLNLSQVEKYSGNTTKMYEYIGQALALNYKQDDVYNNIGALYFEQANYDESLKYYLKAIEINPQCQNTISNIATVSLMKGDLETGWKYYDARKLVKPEHYPQFGQEWNGERNKTVLIVPEQGLGDVLQFCRYVPMVKKLSKKVYMLCPPALIETLKNLEGVDKIIQFVEGRVDVPLFDYCVHLMSLPRIFKTTLNNIPNDQYIFPNKEKSLYWADRMKEYKNLKVGLVWRGNPRKDQNSIELTLIDGRRSVKLKQFEPLFNNNATFFSLQKDDDLNQIQDYPNIINYMDEVKDYSDTAAIINNLDLIISVDTSVVHMAGAMHKPVWTLSRFDGCWRWLLNRSDTPWYPTMKIYRQSKPHDWESVIKDINENLKTLT